MIPLSEWTDLDLLLLTGAAETLAGTPGAVAELLRRERERCAALCDDAAVQERKREDEDASIEAAWMAESLAERIRGLQ